MLTDKLKNMFLFSPDTTAGIERNGVKIESVDTDGLDELEKMIQESEVKDDIEPTENVDTSIETKTDEKIDDKNADDPTAKTDDEIKDDDVVEDKQTGKDKDTLDDKTPKDTDTLDNQDMTIISKDIINRFDEKDRPTLEKYEGKPIDEALKALVNANRLIGKKRGIKEELAKKPDSPLPKPNENNEEFTKLRDRLVESNIQQRHSDYPKDQYEWSELQSENPMKWYSLMQERQELGKQIDAQLNQAVLLQDNIEEVNNDTRLQAAENIQKNIKSSFGIDVAKDLGIDIKADPDVVDEILDSLLLTDDGKLDLDMFYTWEPRPGERKLRYGVAQIRENALEQKFESKFRPHLLMKIREQAFIEGVTAAHNNKIPPSLSGNNTIIRKAPVKQDIPESMEELERLIEESENSE